MGQRIFTNVSPDALQGIYRIYEKDMGADVRAMMGPTGEAVVMVEHPSINPSERERSVRGVARLLQLGRKRAASRADAG